MVELSTCPRNHIIWLINHIWRKKHHRKAYFANHQKTGIPQKNCPFQIWPHKIHDVIVSHLSWKLAERRSSPGRRTVAWASWKLPETSGCRKLLASSARPPALFPGKLHGYCGIILSYNQILLFLTWSPGHEEWRTKHPEHRPKPDVRHAAAKIHKIL